MQIMNARRESKERNITWRIKEDRNCWTLLEHFMELNLCMLYVLSKLKKLEIQCLKWYTIRSWNEEVRAIGSRSHQAEGQFRRLRNQPLAVKSAFGCEISLWLRNQPLAVKSAFGYEISLWLWNGVLQLVKFRSHLARLRNPPECF